MEVCTIRWLGRSRANGQHASVVVKVMTKEDAEKLPKLDDVTFEGSGTGRETCDMCGQEGHLQFETGNLSAFPVIPQVLIRVI